MTTYTGTADGSGNFTVSFGGNSYTSAQKVSVTAEKDGATKTIELFAPSDPTAAGAIRFSGNFTNFPNNIGVVTLSADISGTINQAAFVSSNNSSIWAKATGLNILGNVTAINDIAFSGWTSMSSLTLPNSLLTIGNSSFSGCPAISEILIPDSVTTIGSSAFSTTGQACTKITIGSAITSLGSNCFANMANCNEVVVKPITPPTAGTNFLINLKSTCVIKVPAASLTAYQSATNWSVHASKMVGV